MFSHVIVGSNDLENAEAFYEAILTPLGLHQREVIPDGGPRALCWVGEKHPLPRFYVYMPLDGASASVGNGGMVAFQAASIAAVKAAYRAGIAAKGRDEGAPGPRDYYGAGYYGAYLRDPDGNKVHLVYRGDVWGDV